MTSSSDDSANHTGQAQEESASGAVVETVECPNCGRVFTGTYCPDCGQEADPSVSATGVIGGFFRDLIDVDDGVWPTVVGLTLRPGKTLQRYLSGIRKGLTSPGQYLLAVVVEVGVDRFLAWIGAGDPLGPDSTSSSAPAEGLGKAFDVVLQKNDVFFDGPEARILPTLLMVGLLALLLYRLFRDRLERVAEALAVGSFLFGHIILLFTAANLPYSLSVYLATGHPPEDGLPWLLGFGVLFGYFSVVTYRCFGPGWKPALKGAFALAWALVEVLSIIGAGTFVYAIWLGWTNPDKYVPAEHSVEELAVVYAVGALLFLIPVLVHARVEAYYRLR